VAVYRRSSRTRFLLLLLVLTAITLVTLDTRAGGHGWIGSVRSKVQSAFGPVQDATHSVLRPVGDFFTGAIHYTDLKQENAHLRDELAKQKGQSEQVIATQNELRLLLDNAHLPFVGNIQTVAASLVDTSSSNFENSIQINRGSSSGILVNMPVVTSTGLVGKVIRVSAKRSTVLLLTDPTFSVGVRLSTGDAAVADGTGRGNPMRVDLVPANLNLNQGDTLVTSGLQNEIFPKDIPVGKITRVKQTPGALQEEVSIKPLVNADKLQFVQVLLWSPQS
jgi:rod shape-determining protein MreC